MEVGPRGREPSAKGPFDWSEDQFSRELEFPATSRVTSGTESRFSDPYKKDLNDIGNPGGWIPDSLAEHHGDEDAITITGNPDIRVPEVVKRDNGLHALGALGEEDARED
ncbi:hypothetical protein NDU88_001023 [Pleurodeles waltl]|uniref:Uncharacterized protein n=1 Tax=Pleurodeles waltl TaxID=8319 RepID=A0AAV7MJ98_PLEWA|nr:hypothetical protein NDU88_001023 [Pleurodeles waltl]